MISLVNGDNRIVLDESHCSRYNFIYADMIYENLDLEWIDICLFTLRENGVIAVQTDYHSVANVYLKLQSSGLNFINWIVTLDNWGGRSSRCFGRKHDDILIFSKGKDYFFDGSRVSIPKVTAGTAFDKKGTGVQIPTDNWYDLGNFSTMSKERVKDSSGSNIRWQKSQKLMNRLLIPFTNEWDFVLDPFAGSASLGEWCANNNRNYFGIEYDKEVFEIACKRLAPVL